ncbi:hypothetical protein [Salmonella enterica]|uniref:hypothetical protein n=1 Tax=Salmonella enterica TaxID=28901 RepID=UPI00125DD407|nr:hypothetical protein [Salmonella enterica]QFP53753.1 hypothetical protein E5O18_25515 [Salmonella enterica subsp. enterica serovar 1,4,[5],12:i:-]
MGSCAAPSAKGDDKFITTDYLQQCHELHHWAIQRNGKFGKYVPDSIKNHPWNLKSIPRDIHQNIHGNGPTPYSAFGRWWHGTPEWAKVAQASPVSGGLADSINDEGCGCAN